MKATYTQDQVSAAILTNKNNFNGVSAHVQELKNKVELYKTFSEHHQICLQRDIEFWSEVLKGLKEVA